MILVNNTVNVYSPADCHVSVWSVSYEVTYKQCDLPPCDLFLNAVTQTDYVFYCMLAQRLLKCSCLEKTRVALNTCIKVMDIGITDWL